MADPDGAHRAQVTACTIVARNYLPAARVLAQSYIDQHPDDQFLIAVIDARDDELDAAGDAGAYRVAGSSIFGIDRDSFLRMATAYSITELATAVKPYLLRELRRHSEVVIYLDPDIQVLAPMPKVPELAVSHGVVLTPHFLDPLPRDGMEPDDAVIMGTGMFNLGFVAVSTGSEGFLDFWANRLRHDAIVAPEQQLFTDQRWVDQVPALFSHYVLTDRGFNVAYWNLHERNVDRDTSGALTAGGNRLRFFHFSGYRPEHGWLLSFHCARKPRILLSGNPLLRELCDNYGAALKAAGYGETLASTPYGFANLPDGERITPAMRRLFRQAWVGFERSKDTSPEPPPPPAFGEESGRRFQSWLASPATPGQAAAGLNRLAISVWQRRQDLQLAFPYPCGDHADAFRTWCRSSGADEEQLPSWALPREPRRPQEPDPDFGVNLLGYLTSQLGLGEMGRIVHDTLEHAGIPIASVVEERSVSNKTGMREPVSLGSPRFPVTIFAVNADQTRLVLESHPEASHKRYRIGLWAWELEEFPEWQHDAFELVDEVWTVSEFARTAIAQHSPVPVKTIPVPVRNTEIAENRQRAQGEATRFLFAFDFNSVAARKNPIGAVGAFQRAFPSEGDARLSIKTINAELHPHAAEHLRVAVKDDGRIELIERYLKPEELDELYASSDCYLSLHRSEGFGLTVAEAMARAMPVISTDYSGPREFLDAETGWPIPYQLTTVGENCHPYQPEAIWAEPDLDAAAEAMREIANNPAEAQRRGNAARERILRTRSMTAAGDWMRDQLRNGYQTWQRRQTETASESQAEHALAPLGQAREALRWRPDVHTASTNPLAPAVRKAVLRAIDHYDVHQRNVLGTLVGSTEDTLAHLLGRIESLEDSLQAAQDGIRQVEALGRRVDTLASSVREIRTTDAERERSQRQIHSEQSDLASSLDRHQQAIQEVATANNEALTAQNKRLDSDEHTLQQVIRDLDAIHAAAWQAHASVPRGTEVVLCDAGTLLMPIDSVVFPWIRHHRSWEPSESALMAELAAHNGGTFVDIGAHVGYHSLRLLRTCPELTGVVAVEAEPGNVELLRRNITVNLPQDAAARVQVLPVAAWDTAGQVRLAREERNNSGDYRVSPTHADDDPGVTLPAIRLDEAPELTAGRVGLVKADLQGRDHRALAGMHELLTRDRPDIVCEFCPSAIEQLGDDPAQVLAWYRKLGYTPVPVPEEGPPNDAGAPETTTADTRLIDDARADRRGFSTLWLRPARGS